MGAASLFVHSAHRHPCRSCVSHGNRSRSSFSHYIKRMASAPRSASTAVLSNRITQVQSSLIAKCSSANPRTPRPFAKALEFPVITSIDLSRLTPLRICKWSAIVCIALAAGKKTVQTVLNPFFWMYFSWTWLFWPWIAAVVLAAYGLYCLRKHAQAQASVFEQLIIVISAIAWLTLVPPAHFNGFLEGWPVVFFFVYLYFFFFNSTIRRRLYGDLYLREHDPKWDVKAPKYLRILFSVAVLVGHWFAAAEGPALHLVPGGWANASIWVLIAVTLFMQYHSSLYLAKYSEQVVVPTAVVQFGPYRWVRHPIYASTMLMLATYCAALRAPFSLLFLVGICVAYYEQKTKLEENLMLETFGERYKDYMAKVQYKLIPRVY